MHTYFKIQRCKNCERDMAIVADVYSDIGVRVASFLVRCSFLFGIELNTLIVESRCVSMFTNARVLTVSDFIYRGFTLVGISANLSFNVGLYTLETVPRTNRY